MTHPPSPNTPSVPAGLEIPSTHELTALQRHLAQLCTHFGWVTAVEQKFLLMTEEMGELAKAVRRMERIQTKAASPEQQAQNRTNMEEELADILSYLMDIANHYDIDLGEAYARKMTDNFSRSWK